MMERRPFVALAALLLAGCAGTPRTAEPSSRQPPPAATGAAAPPSAPVPAPAPEPRLTPELAAELVAEQQWLDSFFGGTPVQIERQRDGSLLVGVPREFCFEPGKSRVKPPLAAVLDKVAESLRRRTGARLALLAAPDDAGAAATPLARQRGAQVQKHLRDRGVPPARLAEPSAAAAAGGVQLRIAAAPALPG